jgi:hypothetical protein
MDEKNPDPTERAGVLETPAEHERAVDSKNPEVAERDEDDLDVRPELTVLVGLRDQVQKIRIAEGNRADAATRLEEEDRASLHRMYEKRLDELEFDVTKSVEMEMKQHPAWPWLQRIKGVGATSAALVVGLIDIERAVYPSSLWKFAGYGVTVQDCDKCGGSGEFGSPPEQCPKCEGAGAYGRADRTHKGEKRDYSARLKTMVWRITDLQVKHRGPYRKIYDEAKHGYLTTRGPLSSTPKERQWTLGHCEAAARRKASKLFLAHLWQIWREAEGLPVTKAYIFDHDPEGAHTFIDPWQFLEEFEEAEKIRVAERKKETVRLLAEANELVSPEEAKS